MARGNKPDTSDEPKADSKPMTRIQGRIRSETSDLVSLSAVENLSQPINGQFIFRGDGHQPVYIRGTRGNPERGQVVIPPMEASSQLSTTKEAVLPEKVVIKDVFVSSPYIEADPDSFRMVKQWVDGIEKELLEAGVDPYDAIHNETPNTAEYETFGKEAVTALTIDWLKDSKLRGLAEWRLAMVPHAMALEVLQNPKEGTEIVDPSNGKTLNTLSKEAAMILGHGLDAEGIRARSVAMQYIVEDHLSHVIRDGRHAHLLSLACGTARPVIESARKLNAMHYNVDLTVVDWSKSALDSVSAYAEKVGYNTGALRSLQKSLTNYETFTELARDRHGHKKSYSVVEAMGFMEYLREEDDIFRVEQANPQKLNKRAQSASEFLAESYKLVEPGGILVVGNMVLPRPHLNYLLNVVAWPKIKPRTEEQLIEILNRANILDDPKSDIELYRVQNPDFECHLYDIIKVTKHA